MQVPGVCRRSLLRFLRCFEQRMIPFRVESFPVGGMVHTSQRKSQPEPDPVSFLKADQGLRQVEVSSTFWF